MLTPVSVNETFGFPFETEADLLCTPVFAYEAGPPPLLINPDASVPTLLGALHARLVDLRDSADVLLFVEGQAEVSKVIRPFVRPLEEMELLLVAAQRGLASNQ